MIITHIILRTNDHYNNYYLHFTETGNKKCLKIWNSMTAKKVYNLLLKKENQIGQVNNNNNNIIKNVV